LENENKNKLFRTGVAMKPFTVTVIFVIALLSAVTYAENLPEGKYVFSAPALFGSTEGEARGKLCELETTAKGYQLVLLNNPLSPGSRISFSVENDRIFFDKSYMSSSEIGRTVTGKGTFRDYAIASGKLTVTMGSSGFLLAKRKSSEWSIRTATRSEILESYAEGLEMAEDLLWSNRAIERPTRENAIKALYSVVGYGFTKKDVPVLEQMLESGELNYKDRKFSLSQELPADVEPSMLTISTNVYTESIDLRENNKNAQNVTMKVFSVPSPVKSISPLMVDIPEPQETSEQKKMLPLFLIGIALGLLLVFVIIMVVYCRKRR
jgi:hypothetical protein